jgi:hypothetical protein
VATRTEDQVGRIPIPKPGFLDGCTYLGYREGNRVRRGADGSLYTWDGLHGEIEAFNHTGRHIAVLDAATGVQIKPARGGRRIRV